MDASLLTKRLTKPERNLLVTDKAAQIVAIRHELKSLEQGKPQGNIALKEYLLTKRSLEQKLKELEAQSI